MTGLQIPWDVIDPEGDIRASLFARDGEARQAFWTCGDGWIVGYTTERIRGGKFNGKFAAMAYKPVGKGARSGKAEEYVRVYFRGFAKRKSAKDRAYALYEKHRKH